MHNERERRQQVSQSQRDDRESNQQLTAGARSRDRLERMPQADLAQLADHASACEANAPLLHDIASVRQQSDLAGQLTLAREVNLEPLVGPGEASGLQSRDHSPGANSSMGPGTTAVMRSPHAGMLADVGKGRAFDSPDSWAADEVSQVAARGMQGRAEPLPYRPTLESAFGRRLDDISVYRGPATTDAANQLHANAYAFRGSIALGEKQDLATVAEETAHVLQQRSGRSDALSAGLTDPHGGAEMEAHSIGATIASGGSARGGLASGIASEAVARNSKDTPSTTAPPSSSPEHADGEKEKKKTIADAEKAATTALRNVDVTSSAAVTAAIQKAQTAMATIESAGGRPSLGLKFDIDNLREGHAAYQAVKPKLKDCSGLPAGSPSTYPTCEEQIKAIWAAQSQLRRGCGVMLMPPDLDQFEKKASAKKSEALSAWRELLKACGTTYMKADKNDMSAADAQQLSNEIKAQQPRLDGYISDAAFAGSNCWGLSQGKEKQEQLQRVAEKLIVAFDRYTQIRGIVDDALAVSNPDEKTTMVDQALAIIDRANARLDELLSSKPLIDAKNLKSDKEKLAAARTKWQAQQKDPEKSVDTDQKGLLSRVAGKAVGAIKNVLGEGDFTGRVSSTRAAEQLNALNSRIANEGSPGAEREKLEDQLGDGTLNFADLEKEKEMRKKGQTEGEVTILSEEDKQRYGERARELVQQGNALLTQSARPEVEQQYNQAYDLRIAHTLQLKEEKDQKKPHTRSESDNWKVHMERVNTMAQSKAIPLIEFLQSLRPEMTTCPDPAAHSDMSRIHTKVREEYDKLQRLEREAKRIVELGVSGDVKPSAGPVQEPSMGTDGPVQELGIGGSIGGSHIVNANEDGSFVQLDAELGATAKAANTNLTAGLSAKLGASATQVIGTHQSDAADSRETFNASAGLAADPLKIGKLDDGSIGAKPMEAKVETSLTYGKEQTGRIGHIDRMGRDADVANPNRMVDMSSGKMGVGAEISIDSTLTPGAKVVPLAEFNAVPGSEHTHGLTGMANVQKNVATRAGQLMPGQEQIAQLQQAGAAQRAGSSQTTAATSAAPQSTGAHGPTLEDALRMAQEQRLEVRQKAAVPVPVGA